MNKPSVKTLTSICQDAMFSSPEQSARIIRRILEGKVCPSTFEPVATYRNSLYTDVNPNWFHLKLNAIDLILRGYGVECLQLKGRHYAYYVNFGDTYTPTLIRTHEGRYIVASWGDYLESYEKRHGQVG